MISSILRHAATYHGDKGVVSLSPGEPTLRITYRETERRCRRLAVWLETMEIREGDRVATLAWNTHRHLELYYGVAGLGAVCHTVNPRLSADEVVFILNHAKDRIVFFDDTFAGLAEAVRPRCDSVEHWVRLSEQPCEEGAPFSDALRYEDCLRASHDDYRWPMLDEHAAAGLCYTSGTTGRPKGVLYSHRSTVLHALVTGQAGVLGVHEPDVVLPVVPMFHVNAWGLPHLAPMAGADLVMPGPHLDGESLCRLMNEYQVTFTAGVPSIWHGLWSHLESSGQRLTSVERCVVGGSALPEAMIRYFEEEHQIAMVQGWGMTETSPVCTVSTLSTHSEELSRNQQVRLKARQGRAVFGVDMRIVSDDGQELPWDDEASGELVVRGPWVIERYFGDDGDARLDGWFPTGDVCTIDARGSMKIRDRKKDLIKSGGEWISSAAMENAAMKHPGVAQAAVIGVPHEHWGERPLLIVVPREEHFPDDASLLDHLSRSFERWQLPNHIERVESLPLGATGKVMKRLLREKFTSLAETTSQAGHGR